MPKKLPATVEDCNTEIEKATQKIRRYKNRNEILTQKIRNEEQRLRTHRLIERGRPHSGTEPLHLLAAGVTVREQIGGTVYTVTVSYEGTAGFLRQQRHRMTHTGRSSIFSGFVYRADCGSKMIYGSSNIHSFDQDFFDCSAYRKDKEKCGGRTSTSSMMGWASSLRRN